MSSIPELLKSYCGKCDFTISAEERETARRMAMMCRQVYDDNGELPSGWSISAREIVGLVKTDESIGFRCQLYESNGKCVLAFAGTKCMNGSLENALQLLGQSRAYDKAVEGAKLLVDAVGASHVTFTGHSMGGGLAAAAALFTGAPAIAFNPAWLSSFTREKVCKHPSVSVTNYVIFGEALDVVQRIPQILGTIILAVPLIDMILKNAIKPVGDVKYVYSKLLHVPQRYIDTHLLSTVLEELQKPKSDAFNLSDLPADMFQKNITEGLEQVAAAKIPEILQVLSRATGSQEGGNSAMDMLFNLCSQLKSMTEAQTGRRPGVDDALD
uniref:Phospholipase A1 n=1 Tax=Trypanosoma congolense (strain IL3000) TaxID=1068625 RepID=G0UJ83_TRYCI|nr:phospholipase A1 [Trypanosoma congolense IL3000]